VSKKLRFHFFIFSNRSALIKSPIDKRLDNGRYLYGASEPNVERAMKAAAQELVSGNAYWHALQGMDVMISIPMQTLVEFKGKCFFLNLELMQDRI
jgi:hypothetical protein